MVIIGMLNVNKVVKLSDEELAQMEEERIVSGSPPPDPDDEVLYKEVPIDVRGIIDIDTNYTYYEVDGGVKVESMISDKYALMDVDFDDIFEYYLTTRGNEIIFKNGFDEEPEEEQETIKED